MLKNLTFILFSILLSHGSFAQSDNTPLTHNPGMNTETLISILTAWGNEERIIQGAYHGTENANKDIALIENSDEWFIGAETLIGNFPGSDYQLYTITRKESDRTFRGITFRKTFGRKARKKWKDKDLTIQGPEADETVMPPTEDDASQNRDEQSELTVRSIENEHLKCAPMENSNDDEAKSEFRFDCSSEND